MSHPQQLIETIAAKVAIDYPLDAGYEYIFERAIRGTRMMPDILVQHGGKHVCAVEIGYTRPEKLTAYRTTLRIPDVRWYDKAGNLHGDVREQVVRVSVTAGPSGDVFTYHVRDQVACHDCDGASERRIPPHCADRYIRMFGVDAYDARQSRVLEEEHAYVDTFAITDYIRYWLPTFCDKCGRAWFADDEDGIVLVDMIESCTPTELARLLGARERVSWEQARNAVEAAWGLSLEYEDGQWLREADKAAFQRQLHITRIAARNDPPAKPPGKSPTSPKRARTSPVGGPQPDLFAGMP